MAGAYTVTQAANALTQQWTADYGFKPFEEMVIGNDFDEPNGVSFTGSTLNARQLAKITAQAMAASSTGQSPTYDNTAIINVTGTPSAYQAAVSVPNHLLSRMGDADSAKLLAGFRRQLLGGLNEGIDANLCGPIGSGFSTVIGPGNIDKTALLAAVQAVITNSGNHTEWGVTPLFFKFHPSQIKYVMNISEIMSAELRGDDENPYVTGRIVRALNMAFKETANVQFTGGFYYNMLHTKKAAMLVWNQKPKVKEVQEFEYSSRVLGWTDACAFEQFDEDGVALKSA